MIQPDRIAYRFTFWVLLSSIVTLSAVADEVVTLNTTVQGNQEHPSVTYIVPWREAPPTDLVEMPFNLQTRLINVFDGVNRQEHEREVVFLMQFDAATAEAENHDAINHDAIQ
jgi:hypothetical protein